MKRKGGFVVIGGREFVIPILSPEKLEDIRASFAGYPVDDPTLGRMVALCDIAALLEDDYPDLDLGWLHKNLTPETAQQLIDNLRAQMEFASAERKARPFVPETMQ